MLRQSCSRTLAKVRRSRPGRRSTAGRPQERNDRQSTGSDGLTDATAASRQHGRVEGIAHLLLRSLETACVAVYERFHFSKNAVTEDESICRISSNSPIFWE